MDLLPISDAAKHLPYSRRTLYEMVKNGEINAVNISRGGERPRWAIDMAEIQRLNRRLKKQTQDIR